MLRYCRNNFDVVSGQQSFFLFKNNCCLELCPVLILLLSGCYFLWAFLTFSLKAICVHHILLLDQPGPVTFCHYQSEPKPCF